MFIMRFHVPLFKCAVMLYSFCILILYNVFCRANVAPCLKVTSKTFGTLEEVRLEYLRLSLPIKCKDEFVSR